jgi:hypothetical protein
MSNRLPVLADQIRTVHEAARTAARFSADKAIEAGHLLIEAKEAIGHGQWLPWLKQTGLSERTATGYMRLARLGIKSATVADLGLRTTLTRLAKRRERPAARVEQLLSEVFEPNALVKLHALDEDGGLYVLYLWSHDGLSAHLWLFWPSERWLDDRSMTFAFRGPLQRGGLADRIIEVGFPLARAEMILNLRSFTSLEWLDNLCLLTFSDQLERMATELERPAVKP